MELTKTSIYWIERTYMNGTQLASTVVQHHKLRHSPFNILETIKYHIIVSYSCQILAVHGIKEF